jgi:peptide/nickel transport system permease protein
MGKSEREALVPARQIRDRTWLSQVIRQFTRSRMAQVGILITVVLALLAIGAPLFTDIDPTMLDTTMILRQPSSNHLFGTDEFGRDVLSRVLYGSRISFVVGLSVAGLTTLVGLIAGALAGYFSAIDNVIMRVMDIFMAFPDILLAIGIMAVLGSSLFNIIIALSIIYTARTARVVRSSILDLKQRDFVMSAQVVGASTGRIIVRHLLPNCLAPLLVQQTYILAISILAESALSFLGVGIPPEVPTLGIILADGRDQLQYAPWLALFPGVFISLIVLGLNLLGDGLRDVLDPRLYE